MRTLLQVPLTPLLRTNATKVAEELGFSSLQEVVRIFLTKFAAGKVALSLQETVPLSAKSEKRYEKMERDFIAHKNIRTAHSVDELMRQLHED